METVAKICSGDIRSASRLIRDLEDKLPQARPKLKQLFQYTGKAFVIGITGAPGAGKSTLTDALITEFRKRNKTVGVLAIDPTSPFSGGAILGDRIRMLKHTEDEGVFIRSLATRGALGGLSQAAGDAIHIMGAMGKDIILVETVGIGQQELDIIHHAHSVIVTLVPGMGDEIQSMKAGLMEVADIFVINKADRLGAKQLQSELIALLAASSLPPDAWKPSIVSIGNMYEPAAFAEQTAKLAQKLLEHHSHLLLGGQINLRMERQALVEISDALKDCILAPVLRKLTESGELKNMIRRVKNRETDPYTEAEAAARLFLKIEE